MLSFTLMPVPLTRHPPLENIHIAPAVRLCKSSRYHQINPLSVPAYFWIKKHNFNVETAHQPRRRGCYRVALGERGRCHLQSPPSVTYSYPSLPRQLASTTTVFRLLPSIHHHPPSTIARPVISILIILSISSQQHHQKHYRSQS